MDFSTKLSGWYQQKKRDLPWRNTQDPYVIWISEIILQQTRVDQGRAYFYRFMEAFPDIQSLAEASEEEILKLWQGLGYYSRARNLHKTARTLKEKYNFGFPANYDDVINLPGIGDYTASAILSFAFNKPYPVVDGNVKRVISRIFGFGSEGEPDAGVKKIKEKALELIDKKEPGNFNQAIMEFGALHCKPQNPLCSSCIFKLDCYAFNTGRVNEFPIVGKPVLQKDRYFNYLIIQYKKGNKTHFFIRKRTENDIWKNLYDFPLIETKKRISTPQLKKKAEKLINDENPVNLKDTGQRSKHLLTHQIIHAKFFNVEADSKKAFNRLGGKSGFPLIEVNPESLRLYPIPRLIEKFFEKNQI